MDRIHIRVPGERADPLKKRREGKMIRVTVEMVPFGQESMKRILGVLEIANLRARGNNHADYQVRRYDSSAEKEMWSVKGFDRERGCWALIEEALRKCKENQEAHRAEIADYQRGYREKHREAHIAQCKQYNSVLAEQRRAKRIGAKQKWAAMPQAERKAYAIGKQAQRESTPEVVVSGEQAGGRG